MRPFLILFPLASLNSWAKSSIEHLDSLEGEIRFEMEVGAAKYLGIPRSTVNKKRKQWIKGKA